MTVKALAKRIKGKIEREYRGFCSKVFPASYYKNNLMRGLGEIKRGKAHSRQRLNAIPNIVIEASNTCNLNCEMCRTLSSKRPKAEMSEQLFKRIVNIKKSLKQENLVIHTVGEPFMYSRMEEIFRICSENGMYLMLTTNGLLIDRYIHLIEKYPRVIRRIAFSIDGATPETYEKIRAGGRFDYLISNLDMVKDCLNRKKAAFSISCQVCLSNENFNEIPLFYRRFAKYFDVEGMLFDFVSGLSADSSNGVYLDTKTNLNALYSRNHPCRLLWVQTHILHDGRVSACCRDYDGALIVGDVTREDVTDIWRGEKYNSLRERHETGDVDNIELCNHCYIVDKAVSRVFNDFLKYLFSKFAGYEDEFYLERIRSFLKIVADLKNGKETGLYEKKIRDLLKTER